MQIANGALFWAQPRIPSGDFTPEDPLAIDYIGQQIGNWLWPGFTTRTSRTGYYVVVVYGLKIAEELAHEQGLPLTDDSIRSIFERWEKLWALAVCRWHDGDISGADAPRGKQGVQRYLQGNRSGPFRLDYKLLSRQLELGALGAYLTSLRAHGLVARDRLRPTPLGLELSSWMWRASDGNPAACDTYVKEALTPDTVTVPERLGRATLSSIGAHGRLSKLASNDKLRKRMWEMFFSGHPPPQSLAQLRPMADMLAAAHAEGCSDTRSFLHGVLVSQWGEAHDELRAVVRIAVSFGDLSAYLRAVFDTIYKTVQEGGLQASMRDLTAALASSGALDELPRRAGAFLAIPEAQSRLGGLSMHGDTLLYALREIAGAGSEDVVDAILGYHLKVQRDRKKDGGWLRRDGDLVLMERGGYASWSLNPDAWVVGYKTAPVLQLLKDLGRVP